MKIVIIREPRSYEFPHRYFSVFTYAFGKKFLLRCGTFDQCCHFAYKERTERRAQARARTEIPVNRSGQIPMISWK